MDTWDKEKNYCRSAFRSQVHFYSSLESSDMHFSTEGAMERRSHAKSTNILENKKHRGSNFSLF